MVQVKFVEAFCNATDAAASSASARFYEADALLLNFAGCRWPRRCVHIGNETRCLGFSWKGKSWWQFWGAPNTGFQLLELMEEMGEFKWGFGMCWASSVVKLSMLDVWVWAGNGSHNKYQGIESMECLQSYTVIFLCRWALAELLFPLFVSNNLMLF